MSGPDDTAGANSHKDEPLDFTEPEDISIAERNLSGGDTITAPAFEISQDPSVGTSGQPTADVGDDDSPPAEQEDERRRPSISKPPVATGLDVNPPAPPTASRTTRMKFVCPDCRDAAWGKPALQLICGRCNKQMPPCK